MNAYTPLSRARVRLIERWDASERTAIKGFLATQANATPFHRPEWMEAVAAGTGNRALALVSESEGGVDAYLPLTEVHSPIFGRMLASSGFAVSGGLLARKGANVSVLFAELQDLAARRSCPAIELRGGLLPDGEGWRVREDSHAGFVAPLACDEHQQLLAIPRKQRAEVRKGLEERLAVTVGVAEVDRSAHYRVYAESVRNLGTPVFPRGLFDAVLDRFGDDADILTVWHEGAPVASVLSLYHRGDVMPYWGGGTAAARRLRANDRMYFELMLHARGRGCTRFDFGRSKTGSGAYAFKRNWGFTPEPLRYASWTAFGSPPRDADPTSGRHAARIVLWKRLPLPVANRLGPAIARGLG